jgi:hypothetical protein
MDLYVNLDLKQNPRVKLKNKVAATFVRTDRKQ